MRDNYRISIEDNSLAETLWTETGLKDALKNVCSVDDTTKGKLAAGLNPNIRLYRYDQGQKFGKHIDESVYVSKPIRGHTEYTLLIYLTGGKNDTYSKNPLKGGETKFYDERGRLLISVEPKAGLALLHRHGDICLEHEGAKVVSGQKYVLRSDVVF